MAARSTVILRTAAVLGVLTALAACGADTESGAPQAADAAAAPDPIAASVAALEPGEVMLRALGCEKIMSSSRINTGRLNDELNALVARTPELSFRDLVFAGSDFNLSQEARQTAYKEGKNLTSFGDGVSAEMTAYITECAAITARASVLMDEVKAAKAGA